MACNLFKMFQTENYEKSGALAVQKKLAVLGCFVLRPVESSNGAHILFTLNILPF